MSGSSAIAPANSCCSSKAFGATALPKQPHVFSSNLTRLTASGLAASVRRREKQRFRILCPALVFVLKQCGDDLTRENLMRQAARIKDLQLPMLLPGIRINTSPTDYYPIEQMQLQELDSRRWVRSGEVMGDSARQASCYALALLSDELNDGFGDVSSEC